MAQTLGHANGQQHHESVRPAQQEAGQRVTTHARCPPWVETSPIFFRACYRFPIGGAILWVVVRGVDAVARAPAGADPVHAPVAGPAAVAIAVWSIQRHAWRPLRVRGRREARLSKRARSAYQRSQPIVHPDANQKQLCPTSQGDVPFEQLQPSWHDQGTVPHVSFGAPHRPVPGKSGTCG